MNKYSFVYTKNFFVIDNKVPKMQYLNNNLFFSKENKLYQSETQFKVFERNISSFTFNFNGTELFILNNANFILKYVLDIPWDITSVIESSVKLRILMSESIAYTENNGKQILIISTNSKIYFYNVNDWHDKNIIAISKNHIDNKHSITVTEDCSFLFILDTTKNIVFIYTITESCVINYKNRFFMGSDYDSKCISYSNEKLYFLSYNKNNESFVFEYENHKVYEYKYVPTTPSLTHNTPTLTHNTPSLTHNTPSLSPHNTPTLTHNTPSLSPHNTPTLTHNTPTLSHNTPTLSPHNTPTLSHNTPTLSHNTPTLSH